MTEPVLSHTKYIQSRVTNGLGQHRFVRLPETKALIEETQQTLMAKKTALETVISLLSDAHIEETEGVLKYIETKTIIPTTNPLFYCWLLTFKREGVSTIYFTYIPCPKNSLILEHGHFILPSSILFTEIATALGTLTDTTGGILKLTSISLTTSPRYVNPTSLPSPFPMKASATSQYVRSGYTFYKDDPLTLHEGTLQPCRERRKIAEGIADGLIRLGAAVLVSVEIASFVLTFKVTTATYLSATAISLVGTVMEASMTQGAIPEDLKKNPEPTGPARISRNKEIFKIYRPPDPLAPNISVKLFSNDLGLYAKHLGLTPTSNIFPTITRSIGDENSIVSFTSLLENKNNLDYIEITSDDRSTFEYELWGVYYND